MQAGDPVYYLYTGKKGTPIKFAAIVLGVEDEGVAVRVGRWDVLSKEVETFDSVVSPSSLQPRSIPCAYEDELRSSD